MKAKAERFDVAIDHRLEDISIWADRESFVHILVNLLDNAIKYNLPGGRVHVSDRAEENNAIIEISNTGAGIPEDARDKIFEPFFTVNKDRSRQSGGTGLGLALVKQLMERHNGKIELIDSELGTTFRLIFPARTSPLRKEELL